MPRTRDRRPTTNDQRVAIASRRHLARRQVILRANPEGVSHAVKEGEHGRDVDGLSDLIFAPAGIAKFLHIVGRGACRGVCDLLYVVEQRALGWRQAGIV